MLVKDLIVKLSLLDQNLEVFVEQNDWDSGYGYADSVEVKPIRFEAEDVLENEWPTVDCVVISD